MFELQRCPKCSRATGIRVVPPAATLAKVIPLMKKTGMQPPRDITGKDRIGIPVFAVDRPGTKPGEKDHFYNGKGATCEEAEASGIMEAMERYAAEPQESDEFAHGTYAQAADIGLTVCPEDLILPMPYQEAWPGQDIAWCEGYEMFRGSRCWVPACAVYHPYTPDGDMQLFRSHTNGLAAGNTLEEAILHALLEDIERDAWSIAEYREHAVRDLTVDDPSSVAYRLLQKFRERGVEIHLKEITSDIGIPVIGAAADDVQTRDPEMLTIGIGCHLDPEIAAIRALTEVAQSRATHKDGTKINARLQKITDDMGYDKVKAANRLWFTDCPEKSRLRDIPNLATAYVLDDIEVVLKHLMDAGFDMVVCNDLTRPENG
ncbi:MAG: YcaO-like family protein, partial [Candidatus Methanomethylophilus sp.]|nr:YcaO-like family protein [Methanomethylophilus sp.]